MPLSSRAALLFSFLLKNPCCLMKHLLTFVALILLSVTTYAYNPNSEPPKKIMKSTQARFIEVRKKLDSLYDVVLKRAPESATVQDFASISTTSQVMNYQIPPIAIDANREDLNTSLH